MSDWLVVALLILNIVQYYVNSKERKDLLNRVMSKDYQDYTRTTPPKSRSFLNLERGE